MNSKQTTHHVYLTAQVETNHYCLHICFYMTNSYFVRTPVFHTEGGEPGTPKLKFLPSSFADCATVEFRSENGSDRTSMQE